MCAMNTMSVFLAIKRTTAGAGTERTARTVRSVHTRYSVETATEVAKAEAGVCGERVRPAFHEAVRSAIPQCGQADPRCASEGDPASARRSPYVLDRLTGLS